jgi:hypothetical protein
MSRRTFSCAHRTSSRSSTNSFSLSTSAKYLRREKS